MQASESGFVCEHLDDKHALAGFSSGNEQLDRWLRDSARRAEAQGTGRTWVWHPGDGEVTAYYTLAAHVLHREALSRTQQRFLPREVPAILLAKLALDQRLHGQHLGEQLLVDALTRCVAAGQVVGSRFVVVDAIDDHAAGFYAKYGFTPVPGVPGTEPARLLRRLSAIAGDLAEHATRSER